MLPVIASSGPKTTPSGLFDIQTLASLSEPERVIDSAEEPAVLDDFDLPRFGGTSLVDMPVIPEPPEASTASSTASPPAPAAPSRRAPMMVVAALATTFVGLLFAL